jgi:hypothetical protein
MLICLFLRKKLEFLESSCFCIVFMFIKIDNLFCFYRLSSTHSHDDCTSSYIICHNFCRLRLFFLFLLSFCKTKKSTNKTNDGHQGDQIKIRKIRIFFLKIRKRPEFIFAKSEINQKGPFFAN